MRGGARGRIVTAGLLGIGLGASLMWLWQQQHHHHSPTQAPATTRSSATPTISSDHASSPAFVNRAFSSSSSTQPATVPTVSSSASSREILNQVWPTVRSTLLALVPEQVPPNSIEYLGRLFDENVPGGKLNRGATVVETVRLICGSQQTCDEQLLFKAGILGWCIEMLQAFFLIEDDIMDQSETRRGKICWYKRNEVGLDAINDGCLTESLVFQLLRKFFAHEYFYNELVEIFQDVTFQTEIGQHLDLTTQTKNEPIDLDKFTLARYQLIVKNKTAYYSFYLPIYLGFVLAQVSSSTDIFSRAREICLEMGEYFQIQDDFLDCYGAPEVIGKIGRDIEEAKCSWLIVQALARADENQKEIIRRCYGKNVPSDVASVKQVFNELNLKQIYAEYEAETVRLIQAKIDALPTDGGVPHEVFSALLRKISGRNK